MIMNGILSPLQMWIFVFIKYSSILSHSRTRLNLHKPIKRKWDLRFSCWWLWRMQFFWDMRPCSLVGICWKFRETTHPDLQKMMAVGSSKTQGNFYLTAKCHLGENNILLTDTKQWIQLKHTNNKYIIVRLWKSHRLQKIPTHHSSYASVQNISTLNTVRSKQNHRRHQMKSQKINSWNECYHSLHKLILFQRVRWLLINNNFTNCFTAFWNTVSYYDRITYLTILCVFDHKVYMDISFYEVQNGECYIKEA